jgi:UDP-N-acetylglucosamine--N-acetylmuramyl-(pentapeptide) pyrophosphoryl-undecaprenol N-acetylglucosamine transferase
VLTGFPDAFPGKEEVVGNPVREIISHLPRPRDRFAGRDDRLHLLVLGGSQGARALNEALPKALRELQGARIDVRHQCGEKMRTEAEQAYRAAGVDASVEPFIADMAGAYAWADVVVCRAGALTLAELCAAGVGSVLVPLPTAVDDHQTKNAQYVVQRRAGVLLKQDGDLADKLAMELRNLVLDPAKRLFMAEAARSLARIDAAERVADAVLEEARA